MTIATAYDKWIRCLKPRPRASLRLFCFPHSGGSATAFNGWEQVLPMDIEVCAIQMPGRENRMREAPFTHMEPLVAALETVLAPHITSIPYVFFGHSLGAVIGFELAKQLRRSGYPIPAQLFVSSHRAPQLANPYPPIHHLSNAAFIEELRLYKGTPESVLQNTELMDLVLPYIRADFTIFETYTYTHDLPFDCPITAFGGEKDHKVQRPELAQWRMQTSRTFALHMFAGDHFFLQSNRTAFLQTIMQDLIVLLNQLHGHTIGTPKKI